MLRLTFSAVSLVLTLSAQSYDLVIRDGRVLDPESSLDAIRSIGITAGRIVVVSASPLTGKRVIDAKGSVVVPGFIDLHAHGQDEENQRYQVMDGVTTALELEIGAADVDEWYAAREGKRLIHSGVTVGHVPNRMHVMRDPNPGLVPSGPAANRAATDEEVRAITRRIERGLERGAIGAGFGLQYTPAASRWEVLEVFRAAARAGAPAFVHVRHMGDREPSAVAALEEVIAASAVTGAPVHVVHITSSSLRATPQTLRLIADARARGIDITTECYPYTAAMTELQSAIFADGWQQVLGVDYPAIEWVATGERLTAESFARYRQQGGMVIMHMIPEDVVRTAVGSPLTMIASDGFISNGKGHPRGAGTFTRVLGRYARDERALSLMDAVRKMTLMPARRLESRVPAMRNKGRIKPGADADLTIFDAATVIDRASFREPTLAPAGIRHVLVGGVSVVEDGRLKGGVYPGSAVRAPILEKKDVIVYSETGRFGGWPANHGLWNWGNEILVGFSAAYFQNNNEDRHTMDRSKPEEPRLARSKDGGETWTIEAPRSLLPPEQGGRQPVDLTEPMDFTHPDFAMTIRFTDIHTGPSLLFYSANRGRTWQGPFKFPLLGQEGIAARTDYIVKGKHEALVFLTASKANGREGRPLSARTTDGGRSWQFVSWIGPEPPGFAIMPSTVRLEGSRLLTTVRMKDGAKDWIDAWESRDDGRTWSYKNRPVISTGGYSGNPPSLLKLKDGRLCLTYGYRGVPYGIRATVSADEGQTWSSEIMLRADGAAWDLGYPRSVQRLDGKIVTIYYIPRDKDKERTIEATIWSPPI